MVLRIRGRLSDQSHDTFAKADARGRPIQYPHGRGMMRSRCQIHLEGRVAASGNGTTAESGAGVTTGAVPAVLPPGRPGGGTRPRRPGYPGLSRAPSSELRTVSVNTVAP